MIHHVMATFPTHCPSCSHPLTVVRLRCDSCGTQLEGSFCVHELLLLSPEDLEFMLTFVRVSGSLKEMARLRGQSYPTIRNRLNEIVATLGQLQGSIATKQHEILDAIARGDISVEEGARRLKDVKP
jgi:hypothetical protein